MPRQAFHPVETPGPNVLTKSRSDSLRSMAPLSHLRRLHGCALLLLPAALSAQTKLVLPQAPLLPAHFTTWTATPSTASPDLTLLKDSNTAAIAKEDGLSRTEVQTYTRAGQTVTAQAMQFGDATGAVAAFTLLRQRGMAETVADLGARNHTNTATAGGHTLLREGSSLVVLDGTALPPQDLRALADTLPKIGGPKGLPPLLPTYLPAAGLVPGSVEYAVGPVAYKTAGGLLPADLLGFDKAGESATADYTGRSGIGKLTLLLLPTPQIAGDRGRAIEDWLNSPTAKAAALGSIKLRRIGPMLALATGGFTPEQAAALVDSIHLRTELTWNKPVPPEFHVEVRKTASLLTSIMVFSGVGALAAILLGAFLGFGRAWVRVLLGKPAATEPEFLRLDLRANAEK